MTEGACGDGSIQLVTLEIIFSKTMGISKFILARIQFSLLVLVFVLFTERYNLIVGPLIFLSLFSMGF